jgi:oxygen-dependent protoporphyrinogen oxidase
LKRAIVVGGGISGLSAAYYLAKAGVPASLIDPGESLGGVMRTERVDGCLVEAGPDSFLSVKPWAFELIRSLGLEGEVIGSNDHLRKTYIQRRGRLVPMPDGLQLMVPTRVLPMVSTRLLGWGTKIRMGMEWFRPRGPAPAADRSVSEFLCRHYGREAVDYLAEPLLAGVYGGDPDRLSATSVLPRFVELEEKYGSLTRGVLSARGSAGGAGQPLFRTLKDGFGSLVEAIAKAIAGKVTVVRGAAGALERTAGGWRVRCAGDWMEASHVILACRSYEAADLVGGRLAELLGAIPYNASMTLALGYRRAGFRHPLNGFGFLCPKRERGRMVACTWVGTKFAHRVAEDRVLLRCFLGGGSMGDADEAIVAAVREELRALMGVTEEPLFSRIYRWPRSMAQYEIGHRERIAEVEALLKPLDGLLLAGNAYYGIGVPDCVRMGREMAERVAAGV